MTEAQQRAVETILDEANRQGFGWADQVLLTETMERVVLVSPSNDRRVFFDVESDGTVYRTRYEAGGFGKGAVLAVGVDLREQVRAAAIYLGVTK